MADFQSYIYGGRITCHGIIEQRTNMEFVLKNETPFSLFVVPKDTTQEESIVTLNVRCFEDDQVKPAPFAIYTWSPLLVTKVQVDSELLSKYDIYWGAGSPTEQLPEEDV